MIPYGDIQRFFGFRIAFLLETKVLGHNVITHKTISFLRLPKTSKAIVVSTAENEAHSM
jgi:hypothetical protein